MFVADAALYTQENLQQMKHLRWVSRVPATLTTAKMLLEEMPEVAFNDSAIPGYRIAASCSEYGGVRQSWLVVESQARKEADLKQLEKRLIKKLSLAQSELRQLLNQEFACSKDAVIAAQRLSSQLPLHQLANIHVNEVKKHTGRGRPSKDASPTLYYQVDATLEPKELAIGNGFSSFLVLLVENIIFFIN